MPYLEDNGTPSVGSKDNDQVRLVFEKSPLAAGMGEGLEVGMGELEGGETKEEA